MLRLGLHIWIVILSVRHGTGLPFVILNEVKNPCSLRQNTGRGCQTEKGRKRNTKDA